MSDRAPKARQHRDPVFRADEEPVSQTLETDADGLPTDPIEREALRQRLRAMAAAPAEGPIYGGDPETGDLVRLPTREPIASAPQDGTHFLAYWGAEDEAGRLVRWRQGRHFNGRRWAPGGGWAPADGMIPLPAEPPTEWLKPVEDASAEDEPEAAEEAA